MYKSPVTDQESLSSAATDLNSSGVFHKIHTRFTADSEKTGHKSGKLSPKRHSCAQILGELVQHPVQILVGFAQLLNLLDGMQDRRVVLTPKLPADFRQ